MDKLLALLSLAIPDDPALHPYFDAAYCICLATGVDCEIPPMQYARSRFIDREELNGYQQELWWLIDASRAGVLREVALDARQTLPRLHEANVFGYRDPEYLHWLDRCVWALADWHDAGYSTRYDALKFERDSVFQLSEFQHGALAYRNRVAGAELRQRIGYENFIRGYIPPCRPN